MCLGGCLGVKCANHHSLSLTRSFGLVCMVIVLWTDGLLCFRLLSSEESAGVKHKLVALLLEIQCCHSDSQHDNMLWAELEGFYQD